MKKTLVSVISLSLTLTTIFIVQASAGERSYFRGCDDCGATVNAYCTGEILKEKLTHEYKRTIFSAKETCTYYDHTHTTREKCTANSSHVNTGDEVHGYTGHEGKSVCGVDNITPCEVGEWAYNSDN